MGTANCKSRAGNVKMPFAELLIDRALVARSTSIDPEQVESLAWAVRDGCKEVPRVRVCHVEGRGYLVTRHFHTLEAHRRAGSAEVPCTVRSCTWDEAVIEAAGANAEHDGAGLKRTNADKRRAVEMVLAVRPAWSDGKIAAAVGVSDEMVRKHRPQVPTVGTCPAVREGKDGKAYPAVQPATIPLRERVRADTRPDHLEPFTPSFTFNGCVVLPLMHNGQAWPKVLAAEQLSTKQAQLILNRAIEAAGEPFYFRGRMFEADERAELWAYFLRTVLPEVYEEEGSLYGVNFQVLNKAPAEMLP